MSIESTDHIHQKEHVVIGGVAGKKVYVIDPQGNIVDFGGSSNWAVRTNIDSGDSNIEYVGKAVIGAVTSGAVWQIIKIDETTGTVITWADGDEDFNNIYDNREALSYS